MRRNDRLFASLSVLTLSLFCSFQLSHGDGVATDQMKAASESTLSPFASTAGGFTISVPSDWRPYEFPGSVVYRSTFAPSPVQKGDDRVTLGLYVERTLDYKRAFGWKRGDPESMVVAQLVEVGTLDLVSKGKSLVVSFAPANSTFAQIDLAVATSKAKTPNSGNGLAAVVLLDHEPSIAIPGMETFQYDVISDYRGSSCVYHQFLVAMAKKQWLSFHMTSLGCADRETLTSRFDTMLRSLVVNREWGQ